MCGVQYNRPFCKTERMRCRPSVGLSAGLAAKTQLNSKEGKKALGGCSLLKLKLVVLLDCYSFFLEDKAVTIQKHNQLNLNFEIWPYNEYYLQHMFV